MVAAEHRTDWVQPILVDKAGSHLATIKCAAAASVLAWFHTGQGQPEPWEAWLSGPFTKTVRRASRAQLDRAGAADPNGVTVHLGASRAVAFTPVRYQEMPRDIARLQVSGTNLPVVTEREPREHRAPVRVVVDRALTTGKAAAQAAHALFGWTLRAHPAEVGSWWSHPLTVQVQLVDATVLADAAQTAGAVIIRDAGHTEVAPGTLTAVAVPTATRGHSTHEKTVAHA